MESSRHGSSHVRAVQLEPVPIVGRGTRGPQSTGATGAPDPSIAPRGANVRRLIADQRYFGLDPHALRAGAEQVVARMSALAPAKARIDVRGLGEDFRLGNVASAALLRTLVTAGLLHPDGTGSYCPTERFREYADAWVVTPLPRARAKALIDRACALAAQINADWVRNPFKVKMIAVSGSYMSRRDQLPELSLWLVLRSRPQEQRRKPLSSKADGLRQILTLVDALSSFVVVRVVSDRRAVQRPFSVVFQANEEVMDSSVPAWERLRDWSASISRRLVSK